METIEIAVLKRMIETIKEHADFLTDLDRQIGDSDHGINMMRGFQAIEQKLPELETMNQVDALKTCGMTLLAQVGGASGPLYGTLFIKTAAYLQQHPNELIEAFATGIEAVKERGKSVVNEKTMLDVLVPVVVSLKQTGGDLNQAAIIAHESVIKTKDMVATKGRASYLGERSIGVMDPGAYSSYLLIRAMSEQIKEGAQ